MTPFIHLIQHYCNHRLPAREDEYRFCFGRNLDNPYVKKVHNLVDPGTTVPQEFRDHPKYVEHIHPGQWISFKTALDYVNDRLAGEVACISNLDIFLDHETDWAAALPLVQNSIVLSLSRTEYDGTGATYKDPAFVPLAFANSQDVWMFLAPFEIPDCDFDIGTLGCDNAFAHRIKLAGRIPVNSPNKFKTFHFDQARGKHAGNQLHVHTNERGRHGNTHPEEKGQYLLPDIDAVQSLDALATALNLDQLQRYVLACDMMSRAVKITNR